MPLEPELIGALGGVVGAAFGVLGTWLTVRGTRDERVIDAHAQRDVKAIDADLQRDQLDHAAQENFVKTILDQLHAANQRIDFLQDAYAHVQDAYAKQALQLAELSGQMKVLAHAEEHLKAEKKRLLDLLDEKEAENQHQFERIAELNGRNGELTAQNTRLRHELDAALERARQLDDENRDQEAHIQQRNARLASLEAELITLRGPMRPADQAGGGAT